MFRTFAIATIPTAAVIGAVVAGVRAIGGEADTAGTETNIQGLRGVKV